MNIVHLNRCSAERMALALQRQRMQTAETAQQNACAGAGSAECSNRAATLQSESSLYRELEYRYRQCMARSTTFPFSTFGYGRFRTGGMLPFDDALSFEPWTYESWVFDVGYH